MQANRARRDGAFELKSIDDDGTFTGFGSVYGNVDDYGDIMAAGVFADSLTDWQAKGRMPAMLWQHNSREPIGAYTMLRESDQGLVVQGKLALKTQRGAEAYELMKMKAISGLSVGFLTRDDSRDAKSGLRTIKKADLWEVSLVTFPANDDARVASVKSIEEIEDLHGMELLLRDAGFSRSEAKAMVSRMFAIARREGVKRDEELAAAVAAARRRRDVLSGT